MQKDRDLNCVRINNSGYFIPHLGLIQYASREGRGGGGGGDIWFSPVRQ